MTANTELYAETEEQATISQQFAAGSRQMAAGIKYNPYPAPRNLSKAEAKAAQG